MKKTTKEELYKTLLHLTEYWEVENIEVKEPDEIYVDVGYKGLVWDDPVSGEPCTVYDHRDERLWRHLDTMQYKTYIRCCVPRVTKPDGKIETIDVPWADSFERHTYLLEKKSN